MSHIISTVNREYFRGYNLVIVRDRHLYNTHRLILSINDTLFPINTIFGMGENVIIENENEFIPYSSNDI